MIKSFYDDETEALSRGKALKGVPSDIVRVAVRKLDRLNEARSLNELRVYPKDKLHQLEDDRAGQWSIKVNDQFRICFIWNNGDAERVEFTDYH